MPGWEDPNKSPSEDDNASKTREAFKPFSLSFVSQHGDSVKLDITPDGVCVCVCACVCACVLCVLN